MNITDELDRGWHIGLVWLCTIVTGEQLGLDRGSNPWPFADRANTTTELPSHPVISPTPFHLNPTRLHTSPGSSNSSTNFLWGNPRISYILPRRTYRLNHLSIVGLFMVGAMCNRWTIVARSGLEPRAFHWPCEHYHWATEPPGHLTNNFHLNPTRLHYIFYVHMFFGLMY